MATGMLITGISGIRAAQIGLQVTQHNIANANTDGFSRQYITQSPGIPVSTGAGYLGTGTTVDTVRRAYDQYLTQQTVAAQTKAAESDTMAAKLAQLDNMFGDVNAGLTPAIQDFFEGVNQVAANPALVSARQSMLSASEVLVNRFNSLATRIGEMYDTVNGEIANETQQVNNLAQQIADVNYEIARAMASTSQAPNDMMDLRDRLVAELNTHIKVATVQDSTGNYNVFIGNGQQLVVGTIVNKLVPMTSSNDPERVVVGLQGQSGSVQELQENLIDGGVLGGLLKFRADSLDYAANSLGMVAATLATTFNAQHALGQDLDGLNSVSATAGFQADYFQISGPKVMANSPSAATVTATFLPPTLGANGNFQSALTGSDYVLRNTAGTLTLTRLSDGQAWSDTSVSGLNSKIAGEGFSLAGAAPTADVDYLIEPTRSIALNIKLNSIIAGDPARIAAAAPVGTALGAQNTGSLSVSQGAVATGYGIGNLSNAVFTYSANTQAYGFTQGGAVVTARYADGTTSSISGGSIPRLNGSGKLLTSITFDGITVDIAGVPNTGDSFSIQANVGGVSDSRNALKLAALQTQKISEGGEATLQGSYASMVSKIGADSRQAKVVGQAQQALYEQNEAARSAVSGVNLDEEAANLIKYQQAYQASARALDIASKLFDTLLGITS